MGPALTTIAFLLLIAFSLAAYLLGRGRALSSVQGKAAGLHSLPGYHGSLTAIWVGIPAALLLAAYVMFGHQLERELLMKDPPAAVKSLNSERVPLFFSDAQSLARTGKVTSEATYEDDLRKALEATAAKDKEIEHLVVWGTLATVALFALSGFLFTFPRIGREFRARNRVEGWTAILLIGCSVVAILTTVGIVLSLVWESSRFFHMVPPAQFLLGTDWDPQVAINAEQVIGKSAYGALPLFAGTFLIMGIAMLVAAPVGLFSAIYLSEYSSRGFRGVIKPLLEVLAGVPTVVYGFFAALTVGPIFRAFFNGIGAKLVGGPFNELGLYLVQVQNQMALVAGVVMGIMLIPFVSSLSDDIINSVPQTMRDGSYALGATQSETIQNVVLPAALPGVVGAMLLAVSRAVGETMIVTMAAGLQAKLTANPLDTVTTVTVQIVTLLTGDQEFDSPKTLSAFGLGLTLFVVTLILNVIAMRIVQKYREQYD